MDLKACLYEDFKVILPVTGALGSSPDFPIYVESTPERDYIKREYHTIHCIALVRQFDWEKKFQSLESHNGRMFDVIDVEITKKDKDKTPVGVERYFFDITECMKK